MARLLSFGIFGKVGKSHLHKINVVQKLPEASVAHVAQETTDLAGHVAMVDNKVLGPAVTATPRFFADSAHASLLGEQLIPFFEANPVVEPEASGFLHICNVRTALSGWCMIRNDYGVVEPVNPTIIDFFRAAWSMVHEGSVTVLFPAIRAFMENPLAWTLKLVPGSSWLRMAKSPFMVLRHATGLAIPGAAISVLGGSRKLISIDKFLTHGAKFLFRGLLGGLGAFLSDVTKEALDGYGFTAPRAIHSSGYCFKFAGHGF